MSKTNCNYKSSMTKKKAFTLIELLIVIAIIGILFIVLVSKVDFATDKAKTSGVQTDFRSFQVTLETVSKENAGFNTFGWDTGDNAGASPSGYTYTNATKDAGDRIRNSYDEGDTNLNGIYDDGEVWTGRKVYTENWTGCYTLINPGNASDMSAIFDLETAINKNLDPKLHIVIADDGTITMANGYKDPWSTQYHGRYITNASADAAAKWNTDASMAGSAGDNMDRGAILMYSNGANQKFGTKVKIEKGVVTATVSQIDADHPDNNKMGADDYVLAVVYTYTNGYGETSAITSGFSNNQVFLTGNGGNVGNAVDGGNNVGGAPTMLNGSNQECNLVDGKNAAFRANMDFNTFDHVKVDNEIISESHYTTKSGSTIVILKADFLATLSEGVHKLDIVNKNGESISCEFTMYSCNHEFALDEWGERRGGCTCLKCNRIFHSTDEQHNCFFCFGSVDNATIPDSHIDNDGDYYCDVCTFKACAQYGNVKGVQHKELTENGACTFCYYNYHEPDEYGYCYVCEYNMCWCEVNPTPHIDMNDDYRCDICTDPQSICGAWSGEHNPRDNDNDLRCDGCHYPICWETEHISDGNGYCKGCDGRMCSLGVDHVFKNNRCIYCDMPMELNNVLRWNGRDNGNWDCINVLQYSINNGVTWNDTSPKFTDWRFCGDDFNIECINNIICIQTDLAVYVSTDYGQSFVEVDFSFVPYFERFYDLEIVNGRFELGIRQSSQTSSYVSTDGINWTKK